MKHSLPYKVSLLSLAVALTACGGDNSSSKKTSIVVDDEIIDSLAPVIDTEDPVIDTEEPALPTYRISARGGNGSLNSSESTGGDGGYVYIYKQAPGSDVTVTSAASVTYAPILPAYEPDLGDNALTVSADTLVSYENGELNEGDLYLYDGAMYRYDGATETYTDEETEEEVTEQVYGSEESLITGIQVNEGATLTLHGVEGTYLYVDNDVVNNGTIGTNDYNLDISANAYIASGNIVAPSKRVTINAELIRNAGTIDVNAADSGYAGGYIQLNGTAIENSGTLTANGLLGDGESSGTIGGYVSIAGYVAAMNSGTITANSAAGGYMGYSGVSLASTVAVVNTGTISGAGLDATADDTYGGMGTTVNLNLQANSFDYDVPEEYADLTITPVMVNTGSIDVSGGAAKGDASPGSAGYIQFSVYDAYDNGEVETILAASKVAITGALTADGGSADEEADGYSGASGGYVMMNHSSILETAESTLFAGYTDIDLNGGDGAEGSGNGGGVYISTNYSSSGPRLAAVAVEESTEETAEEATVAISPSVTVTTNINVSAGTLVTAEEAELYEAYPGNGGYFSIYSNSGSEGDTATINVEGDIVANGAGISAYTEYAEGTTGGSMMIRGVSDVSVAGSFTANGGDVANVYELDDSNEGGSVEIYSQFGAVVISSDITLNSGSSDSYTYEGGNLVIDAANSISMTGTFTARGGDATAEEVESGNGGELYANSGTGEYTMPTTFDLAAGSALTEGLEGHEGSIYNVIDEDTVCVAGYCPVVEEEEEVVIAD